MLVAQNSDLFFYYLMEREKIRINKEVKKLPKPWTTDPILQRYKFTNVLRENDRTTRWMRQNWTKPNEDKPLEIQLLNCGIFRYFGSMEFATEIGYQTEWNPEKLKSTAKRMLSEGKKVFTGAYVITNNGRLGNKYDVVCDDFLTPFWQSASDIVKIAQETQRWELATKRLMKVFGFGGSGFMAKEVMSDAIQTPILRNAIDRNTWSPVGPGARRGLNALHGREPDKVISEEQGLQEMLELFDLAKVLFPAWMPKVGQEFDLHCVQFGLCEIYKYLKVRRGEGRPRSTYAGLK